MCAWFVPRPDAPIDSARLGLERAAESHSSSRSEAMRLVEAPSSSRREALRFLAAAVLAAGALPRPDALAAENGALAFGSGTLEGALAALGATLDPSPQIRLTVPDFVENGSLVPVEVTSQLSGPQTIFILSEANPFPLVARFVVPEGTVPYVSTRIKVAQSCNIHALVQADGRCYSAVKSTTVAIGGCGNG